MITEVLLAVLVIYILSFTKEAMSKARQFWMIRNLPGPKRPFFIGTFFDMVESGHVSMKFLMVEAERLRAQGEKILVAVCVGRVFTIPLDGDAVKPISNSQDEITKGHDYDFLYSWLETGLLISSGAKWRARRKMLTPMFHLSMLKGYVDKFNENSKNLVSVMKENFHGKVCDLFPYFKLCTLDIMCDCAMGTKLNSVRDPELPYAKNVDLFNKMCYRYSIEFWMWFPVTWFLFYYRKFHSLLKSLKSFSMDIIVQRHADIKAGKIQYQDGEKKPFLDLVLELYDKGEMTMDDVREEVDTFMFAGHDTTASSIAWFFWCMATSPKHQELVYEELKEIFGEDTERDCTNDDLAKMELFERCIKESMRLFSTVPLCERKLKNDFAFGEHIIPKDSEIFITPMIIGHNKDVFGENHWEFDPDRFLPEAVEKRQSHDYIPFSSGPRNCIGQKFAFLELKMIGSWLLRHYRVETDKKLQDNEWQPELIMRPKDGCVVRMIPRKTDRAAA